MGSGNRWPNFSRFYKVEFFPRNRGPLIKIVIDSFCVNKFH